MTITDDYKIFEDKYYSELTKLKKENYELKDNVKLLEGEKLEVQLNKDKLRECYDELKKDTWTDEQIEEKIEEVFDEYELEDNYLSQEDEFNLESWLNDVAEDIKINENEVDRLSELESIAWIDFYGEKEVIDNGAGIKICKFREDILKMKEENKIQKQIIRETKRQMGYSVSDTEEEDDDEDE